MNAQWNALNPINPGPGTAVRIYEYGNGAANKVIVQPNDTILTMLQKARPGFIRLAPVPNNQLQRRVNVDCGNGVHMHGMIFSLPFNAVVSTLLRAALGATFFIFRVTGEHYTLCFNACDIFIRLC